jgi:peptidoglycan/LPS O-acetylase OafA/YrhL
VRPGEGSDVAHDTGAFSPGLGALRGFAAIGVVIYHAFLFVPFGGVDDPHTQAIDLTDESLVAQHLFLGLVNGRGLVTLFFVLSGCVLALSLDRKRSFGGADIPGYMVRRGLRLYPLLIAAATAAAILQWSIGPRALASASSWANWHYEIPEGALLYEWFKNAIGHSASLNSPAWSIRVELIASVMFPLLYALSLGPVPAGAALVLIVLVMFLVPGTLADMHVFTFSFFLGALIPRVGAAVARRYERWDASRRWAVLAAVVLAFMFSRRLIDPVSRDSAPVIIIESLCAAFIIALALFRQPPRLFTRPAVQWLGQISYGIYLLHLIVLFALAYAFLPAAPLQDAWESGFVAAMLCVATLAITLPLAWLTYRTLEAPLQRLGATLDRGMTRFLKR